MRAKDALGRHGELLATRHLLASGLEILDRNWRCDIGEIDIVARDGATVVICEVRTRSTERFGHPLSSVTEHKVERLRRLAVRWLMAHDMRGLPVRIDVIGILRPRTGPAVLRHIRAVA